MKEKSEKPWLTNVKVDQFPHKSLGVHVNVFANKLKFVQHHDHKKIC